MDARKEAQGYIEYFKESVQESSNNPEDKLSKVWQHGLLIAQEWLKLIDAQAISEGEFQRFIGAIHANRYMSSAWGGLARDAYAWAVQKGFSLPDEHEFFASSSYFVHDYIQSLLSTKFPGGDGYLEMANRLFAYFEENHFEDSRNPIWQRGYEISKEWIRLLQSEIPNPLEMNGLVEKIFSLEYRTVYLEFFIIYIGLCRWIVEMGFEQYLQDDKVRAFKQFIPKR